MPLDDVVILDIDESTIESPHCEDLNSLPPDVIATLKHVLKKQSSAYGHTVSKAFMLAQVSMLGGYRSALKLRPVGGEGVRTVRGVSVASVSATAVLAGRFM